MAARRRPPGSRFRPYCAMRTSPEVTDVSGTMREAQNRNTSPSNSCSGAMMSTGGRAAAVPGTGDLVQSRSPSAPGYPGAHVTDADGGGSRRRPAAAAPSAGCCPRPPAPAGQRGIYPGRHSPPAGRIVVFIVSPFLIWGVVETGRRTPRAFVPLRSTAGRRPLRAVRRTHP